MSQPSSTTGHGPDEAATALGAPPSWPERVWRAYWPEVSIDSYPRSAMHRALSVFCLLGGFVAIGITLAFARKNFGEHPTQGALQLLLAATLLAAPLAIGRGLRLRTVAHLVVGVCFVALTLLCFRLDGLLSSKALFYLTLSMTAVLMFGPRIGAVWTGASIAVLISLHVFRDRVGGNMAADFTPDQMSEVMLFGLISALIFVFVACAVFITEMRRTFYGLKEARAKAQAADQAKSRFLASISHEMRTPLAGIMHIAKMLEPGASSAERRRLVKTVESSGQSLLTVIDDILDVATLESRGLKLSNKPFNLRVVAESVLNLLSGKAADKSLNLRLRSQPDMPASLTGDPVRIGQVLTNLVANAIKYTDYGVVSIELAGTRDGDHALVQISVADTGVGIPVEDQQRVFEPFAQSETGNFDGVGLGLSIVRGLVEAMSGSIELLSEPGHGSRFRITLPLRVASQSADQVPGLSRLNARVWAVSGGDGANVGLDLLEPLVTGLVVYPDPESLIEKLGDSRELPDLLVMAETHANRYALRAAEAVRDLPAPASIPMLLLSDEISTGQLKRVYTMPRCGYVVLPATPAELFSNIESLVRPVARDVPSPAPADACGDEKAAASADTDPSQPRRRLLVAEDNPINRSFLQRFLPGHRFEVTYAVNGAEAVERWREADYAAILMDISMPVMDGVEATREIRRLEAAEERPRTPIIALTAYSTADDLSRFRDAGVDDHLAKPYRIHDMLARIDRWCRSSGAVPRLIAGGKS